MAVPQFSIPTPIRQRQSKKITLTCAGCGDPFSVYRYDHEKRGRKFCSAACQGKASKMEPPPRDEIVDLYSQGVSTPALAAHYGVSKGTIYNWLKAYGIKTRTIGEGVTLAQTGKEHTPEWNAAIGRGNTGTIRDDMVGPNNPIFRNSTTGQHYSKAGIRPDLGIYVRSSWEANYCRYLNWLVGQGQIKSWRYEPVTFWFEKIKRGVRSWKPDFEVTNLDDSLEYHEVKGWDYPRGKVARKRMAIYHPKVKIVLIDEDQYKAIRKWKGLIPEWEGR